MNIHRTLQTEYQRLCVALLLAALLSVSTVIAHNQLSFLTGIGTPFVAQACQGPSAGC
jgi:hypothetical protein